LIARKIGPAGVIASPFAIRVGAVTVRFVIPVTPFRVALIMVVPAATVVAKPLLATMVATPTADELQAAVLVTGADVPSEKLPVAMKSTVFEKPVTVELGGVTVIDRSTAAVTVNVAVPLTGTAPKVAFIVEVPTVRPWARPLLAGRSLTVATAGVLEVQVASNVKSCVVIVVPSKKVPLAVNWVVNPLGTVAEAGVTVTV
jgi:hypothetical protein